MTTRMKSPLHLVLMMLVGVFLATPALAQDEAAAEDASSASEEAVQIPEDAVPPADDAFEAVEDAAETTEGAIETTEDVQITEDAEAIQDDSQLAQDTSTVEWVVNEAADAAPVTLKGRLVEALGDNEYVFEDATGTVQVEIDEAVFGPDEFQAGLEIEIVGEVDKADQDDVVEIDVESVNMV